jgi:hypothetical protein
MVSGIYKIPYFILQGLSISLSMDKMIDQIKYRHKDRTYSTRGTDGQRTRFSRKNTLKEKKSLGTLRYK